MNWIKKALYKAGLHIYGKFELTRYNPALDMSVYHSHCSCGRNRSFQIWKVGGKPTSHPPK